MSDTLAVIVSAAQYKMLLEQLGEEVIERPVMKLDADALVRFRPTPEHWERIQALLNERWITDDETIITSDG